MDERRLADPRAGCEVITKHGGIFVALARGQGYEFLEQSLIKLTALNIRREF